jgi:hypothetical protein
LDYIDFIHPNLKQHTSNLSAILPGIVESGLPTWKMVLETYTSDRLGELSSRPFNELFEFCAVRDSQPNVGLCLDQMPAADDPSSPHSSVGVSSEDLSSGMAGVLESMGVGTCTFSPASRGGRSPETEESGPPSDALLGGTFDSQSLSGPLFPEVEFFDGEAMPTNFPPVLAQVGLYDTEYVPESTVARLWNTYKGEAPLQDSDGISVQPADMPQPVGCTNNDRGVSTIDPRDIMSTPSPLRRPTFMPVNNSMQYPSALERTKSWSRCQRQVLLDTIWTSER